MKDIIYQELRECNKAIRMNRQLEDGTEGDKLLADTVRKICELAMAARENGLLFLDCETDYLDAFKNGKYLKKMISMIVDGADPDLIEEVCITKYFSSDFTGYDALQYIVMLYGALAIQAGKNPVVIREKLLALIPEEAVEIYNIEAKKVPFATNTRIIDYSKINIEKYYEGDIPAVPGDPYYFLFKVTDYAILSLDDRSTQRMLRELDNIDLKVGMRGLSGDARMHLFSNLSKRLSYLIAEEMDMMGDVMAKDVENAVSKIFGLIISLLKSGEIKSGDSEALLAFGKIFNSYNNDSSGQEIAESENELYKIMKEYNSPRNKVITGPWSNS